jgi:hypothetical protein
MSVESPAQLGNVGYTMTAQGLTDDRVVVSSIDRAHGIMDVNTDGEGTCSDADGNCGTYDNGS